VTLAPNFYQAIDGLYRGMNMAIYKSKDFINTFFGKI